MRIEQGIPKRKKVAIVKNHYPINDDPRVTNLIKMLKTDYEIIYLGWNRNPEPLPHASTDYGNCKSVVLNFRSPIGGPRSFFFFPFWWFFVLVKLLKADWDIVHVINFPSLPPSILAAKLRKKTLVYDVLDTFEDQMPLPALFRTLFLQIDKLLMKHVNAVVLVDEMQVEEFGGLTNPNTLVVYDIPQELSIPSTKIESGHVFTLFHPGYLDRSRNLNIEAMMEAVEGIEHVKVIFAGDGDLTEEIQSKSREMPEKIVYIGRVPYQKVLEMSYEVDVYFQLREPYPLIQKYICGSKLFQAMMCGKPFLVHKGTSTAMKVLRANCGIVVDAHNIEELRRAIVTLKENEEFRKELGLNARIAYETIYSWEIMKQRLLNLYCKILYKTDGLTR